MRGSVLLGLYAHRVEVAGYDAHAVLTYTWLVQALLAASSIWGWREIADRVRSGDIAIDLTRPVDLQLAGLAADLGRALYHLLFRGIPPLLVGALLFGLTLPSGPDAVAAFALSVVLAVALSYAFRFLFNLAAFWLVDARGVMVLSTLVATAFSGFLVPVAFFPDWLASMAYATPFPAMLQTPIDIFIGVSTGREAIAALAAQAAWLAVLLLAGRLVLDLGSRRLVIQGG